MFGKTLWSYLKEHKFSFVSIILIIFVVTILAVLPAQILKVIVDEITNRKNYNKVVILAAIYTCSYVLLGLSNFLKDLLMLNISQGFLAKLKVKMLKHIHNINYQTLVTNNSGNLEAYFANDTNSINELFTSGVIDMITDLFKIIAIVISIFIYSIVFGGITLLITPILALFTSFVRKKMLKAQLKTKNLEGNVNEELLDNIENIKDIKFNKAYNYITSRYDRVLSNHYKVNQTSNFYDAMFSPMMQIFRNVVIVIILLVSGINQDVFGMTIGMIIASISLITDLFSPIENLGMEIQTIQKSLAAIKRINDFFNLNINDSKIISDFGDDLEIVFKDVSFSYDREEIIKNFNLIISSHDKIVLQGPSGSGKSTLMKLALGIIKPTKGEVLLGNTPTYLLDDKNREKLIQIIYQDPFFSNKTIYEELTLLDDSISKEKCQQALTKVGLKVKDLDIKLNPAEYSSGELALFNVARVLVHNPKIIFLDEMNSKIDPYTSKKIIDLINEFARDKMVISINHYGSPIENAKIIKLSY